MFACACLEPCAIMPNDYCVNSGPQALASKGAERAACRPGSPVEHAVAVLCMQVEALNELGDVYAHFGSWKEAVQAWNDALDCMIGPYQVADHAPL